MAVSTTKEGTLTTRRKYLLSFAKLLLVAGLMAYVFARIQWHDTLTTVAADGTRAEVAGTIVGDWDARLVQFRPAGAATPLEAETGRGADGTVRQVSPSFTTAIRNLDGWLFLAGALCYFLSITISAVRWWWLLRASALDVGFFEALRFTWIGIFFNNVVPGQTGGDVVKALYIMKRCPGARASALVSVVVDRVIGLGSLMLLGAIAVLLALDRFGALALAIWGLVVAVTLTGVLAFSRRVRRFLRIERMLDRLPAGIGGPLKRLDQAVFAYRAHWRGIVGWIVFGMAIHVLGVLSIAIVGIALGVGLPLADYFVLMPVIGVVSAIPIAPNGWGIGEFLYQTLFEKYGAAVPGIGTRAVALSVLFRVHITAWSLLGGLLVLFGKERVTRSEVDQEAALERTEDGPVR